MAADAPWGLHYHKHGIFNGMHCQPMAGVACLGLQRDAWKHPGPDMSAVFSSVAAGEPGGHPFG